MNRLQFTFNAPSGVKLFPEFSSLASAHREPIIILIHEGRKTP